MRKPALLLFLTLAACSSPEPPATTSCAARAKPATPPPPAAAQAREIIEKAPEFGEFEFTNAAYSVPIAKAQRNVPQNEAVRQLTKGKWVRLDGNGDIVLTSTAETDRRFIVRPNGILDIVPLAKKELGDVTAVRANPDGTAAADFSWKWVPNDVGSSFTSGPVHERFQGTQNATATLLWDGTSWSVLGISRR
jgi:hypothetical protein